MNWDSINQQASRYSETRMADYRTAQQKRRYFYDPEMPNHNREKERKAPLWKKIGHIMSYALVVIFLIIFIYWIYLS